MERDEPLFEISTDKVDTEIPSPAAGVLSEVLVEEGKTVAISTVVGRIEEGAGGAAQRQQPPAPAHRAAQPAPSALRHRRRRPLQARRSRNPCHRGRTEPVEEPRRREADRPGSAVAAGAQDGPRV